MSAVQSSSSGFFHRLLIVALGTLIAMAVGIGMIGFIADPNGDEIWMGFGSVMLLILCFGAVLAAETARRRERFPVTMIFSMTACGIGTIGMLILIWFEREISDPESLGRLSSVCLACGVVMAHTGAFSLIEAKTWPLRVFKMAVMANAWLVFLFVVAVMWLTIYMRGGFGMIIWFGVLGAFLMVCLGVGTVAVPIAALSRANKDIPATESVDVNVVVFMSCPKCGWRQNHRVGNSRCESCGTGVFIEIEEPRCECGYLVYQLKGDTCPECGRAVQAFARA